MHNPPSIEFIFSSIRTRPYSGLINSLNMSTYAFTAFVCIVLLCITFQRVMIDMNT